MSATGTAMLAAEQYRAEALAETSRIDAIGKGRGDATIGALLFGLGVWRGL